MASGDDRFLIHEAANGIKEAFSYAEFDELITTTARALHDNFGVEPGDHVLIHLPNSPAHLQTWFALAKLGAVTVHSNTNHTEREITYTFDNSDSRLAVTRPDFESTIEEAVENVSTVKETIYTNNPTDEDVTAFAEGRLADFKIPKIVEFVDDFPRTSIGKIEKSAFREREAGSEER